MLIKPGDIITKGYNKYQSESDYVLGLSFVNHKPVDDKQIMKVGIINTECFTNEQINIIKKRLPKINFV